MASRHSYTASIWCPCMHMWPIQQQTPLRLRIHSAPSIDLAGLYISDIISAVWKSPKCRAVVEAGQSVPSPDSTHFFYTVPAPVAWLELFIPDYLSRTVSICRYRPTYKLDPLQSIRCAMSRLLHTVEPIFSVSVINWTKCIMNRRLHLLSFALARGLYPAIACS